MPDKARQRPKRSKGQPDLLPTGPQVDYSALRVNLACIAALAALAITTNQWAFVGYISAVMLISAMFPSAAQFTLLYFRILKRAEIVKPDVRADQPEPHLFAQLLVGLLTLLAVLAALLFRATTFGWALVWLVLGLALLQLLTGICMGCRLYFALQRMGVPGFLPPPSDSAR